MKKIAKTIAVLTLSACVMTGGALSSFAAQGSAYRITGYKTSTCEVYDGDDYKNAVILAEYTAADGSTKSYTFCAECGRSTAKRGWRRSPTAFRRMGISMFTAGRWTTGTR